MSDKPGELVAIHNPETGERGHISASILEENKKLLDLLGYVTLETRPDGFRKRRKRPKGWMKEAIANGEIADPDNPAPPSRFGPDAVVFDVPCAHMEFKAQAPK